MNKSKWELIKALNDPDLLKRVLKEEEKEWDFSALHSKETFGLGFEYGAIWALRWLERNGHLREDKRKSMEQISKNIETNNKSKPTKEKMDELFEALLEEEGNKK